jgi:oligopeptide/dipeptide ABC transporter ATP-binding protein
MSAPIPLLTIDDLAIDLQTFRGRARVVDGVSLSINPGETLGLVGESGSGKSLTASAIIRLLPRAARIVGGSVRFEDNDLVGASEEELAKIRGGKIAMIFQSSVLVLNPLMRVGDQIARVCRAHGSGDDGDANDRAVELLAQVGMANPERVARSYPHQLSGGMVQRAQIALMMAPRPRLLVADEPTTGLDVTTEAQIFDLLRHLRETTGVAILLISHDLGTVAENCDRVAIMHGGHIVETGPTRAIFKQPRHPYTQALLASIPRADRAMPLTSPLRGQAPDVFALPDRGCRFAMRCPAVMETCRVERPPLVATEPDHLVLCELYRPRAGSPAEAEVVARA